MFCCREYSSEAECNPTASLNKQPGIYIFPVKNQNAEQQQKDKQACYEWAVNNSGVGPLKLQAVKGDSVNTGRQGEVVRCAAL